MSDQPSFNALTVDLEANVARVTIDSGPINLLDAGLLFELVQLEQWLSATDDVRVVVFDSANPDFFISHVDLDLIEGTMADPEPSVRMFQDLVLKFAALTPLTIAMVEGRVGGGGNEFVLSMDLCFAARGKAIFNQMEVALGLLPAGSGSQRLARTLGRARALEVILGCDDIDADTADRYGWINRALDAEELGPFVERLAGRIASSPLDRIRLAKTCVDALSVDIGPGLDVEVDSYVETVKAGDSTARIQQFLELGGQTPAGEHRVGDLLGELG